MNLVLSILLAAVLIGLFAPRISARTYWAMAALICLVIAYSFFKHAG